MTNRRLSGFLDALAAGRRPIGLTADPDDAEIIQTAIALRTPRPGDSAPRRQFIEDLSRPCPSTKKPPSFRRLDHSSSNADEPPLSQSPPAVYSHYWGHLLRYRDPGELDRHHRHFECPSTQ